MRPVAYSVSNVLQLVGISRTKLYQVVGSGQLKIRKIGNRTIILAADLEAWLDSLPRFEKGERE